MTRRLATFVVALSAAAAACRAIPAPANGVLSVSEVQLPSPGVVVGDTLRDSTGQVAPLRVYAFGVGGQADTLHDAVGQFVLLDSGAHLTGNGYLVGDSIRASVRVVGSVGMLQTSAATVSVTPRPDSIGSALTAAIATVAFNPLDSTATANYSTALAANVVSMDSVPPAAVQSVVVHYAIVYQPAASVPGAASAVLVDPLGNPSTVDTTDVNGQVSRRIRVRPQAPTVADSVVVKVTAQYRGVLLRGSPVLFVVPIQGPQISGSRRH
ncbi:MAG: hypothetical protein WBQ26_05965 [Gemmatimonadaceae bacterium]|nr:hypothetical protein [Gemmatimonadaceae bacterium]